VRQRFLTHRPERAAFFIRAKLVQVRCATRLYIFLRRTLIRNLCRRQFDKGEEMAGVPAGGSQVERTFRFRLCCPAIRHLNFEDRLLVRKNNRFRPQRRVRDQDRDERADKTESRFSHAAIMGKSPAACRALHPESLNSYFPPTAGSRASNENGTDWQAVTYTLTAGWMSRASPSTRSATAGRTARSCGLRVGFHGKFGIKAA